MGDAEVSEEPSIRWLPVLVLHPAWRACRMNLPELLCLVGKVEYGRSICWFYLHRCGRIW